MIIYAIYEDGIVNRPPLVCHEEMLSVYVKAMLINDPSLLRVALLGKLEVSPMVCWFVRDTDLAAHDPEPVGDHAIPLVSIRVDDYDCVTCDQAHDWAVAIMEDNAEFDRRVKALSEEVSK